RGNKRVYSSYQISELEKVFESERFIPRHRRVDIARRLGLNEYQVNAWFYNKRKRHRNKTLKSTNETLKNDQEDSSPSSPASDIQSSVELVVNPTENCQLECSRLRSEYDQDKETEE
ncbi:hypothetical protein GWI33_011863, partial [Rhynchophorus ferrugineus]